MEVKRLGRVAGGLDLRLCLFKKASHLFPQSNSIDGRDWPKIKLFAPTTATAGVAGNSGTLLQTILTGITAIVDTNTLAQERKNQAGNVINVGALLADVKTIYKKVNVFC